MRVLIIAVLSWFSLSAEAASAPYRQDLKNHDQISRAFDLVVEKHLDPVDPSALAMHGYQGLLAAAERQGLTINEKKQVTSKSDLLAAFDEIQAPNEAIERALIGGALSGMVVSIDKVSWWDDRNDAPKASGKAPGGSIGISLFIKDSVPVVAAVAWGQLAHRAGVHRDDHIIEIDNQSTAGKSLDEIMANITGDPGTFVSLKIERDNKVRNLPQIVRINRSPVQPIITKMIEHCAYIRIDNFNSPATAQNVRSSVKSILRPKPSSVILDLRSNAGGILDEIVKVSDLFMESGRIGSAEGRSRDTDREFVATPGDITNGLPLAVLIDGETASGAEMLVAALTENRHAATIGLPTAGKAVVKTIFELGDNFVLGLATETLLTAKGEPIESHGINPSSIVPETVEGKAFVPGEIGLDPQLDRALLILNGS